MFATATEMTPTDSTFALPIDRTTEASQVVPGRPSEQLRVDETTPDEDEIQYPTGPKVYITLACLYTAYFLNGLDLTIVAVCVPKLTDYFKTLSDIGWYSAAYGMVAAAFTFLSGKACTVFAPKQLVLVGLLTFTIGSALCTFAVTSFMFILGRAVCGLAAAMVGMSAVVMINNMFPKRKRSMWISLAGTAQGVGLVSAPFLGGVLVDHFTWRACFGINLILCPLCWLLTWQCMEDPITNANLRLPLKQKVKMLDTLSTVVVVPSVTCLLLGLQWGGIKYGWSDARIISLLLLFGGLFGIFVWLQYVRGERAMIPSRVIRQRSVLSAMWFGACTNGVLAMTEYYISIYFQGVRGFSATKAGLLGLPMIAGLVGASLLTGFMTPVVGYYTQNMYATSVLAPIAAGLLTTLQPYDHPAKAAGLLGFLGFAIGVGNIAPLNAVTTVLSPKDVSIGVALAGFAGGIGSALFLSTSASLFQGRLRAEITAFAPGTNVTVIEKSGLSDIRSAVGPERLASVLAGYDNAIVQTLYYPLALTLATILASVSMEWVSLKKKRE